jgi:hypothetical protein
MTNYSLHLIDTQEPSNLCFDKHRKELFFDIVTKQECDDLFQNKLIVLCSDESVKKGECYMQCYTHKKGEQWIIRWAENSGEKAEHLKKIIATNSKEITPNCYISEDKVKEFAEYWNKYKELPKFDIEEKEYDRNKFNITGVFQSFNNQLQIKWLPKEETKFESHISEVSETAFDLLVECELQLEYLNQKFGQTNTTNALISKLKNFTQKK